MPYVERFPRSPKFSYDSTLTTDMRRNNRDVEVARTVREAIDTPCLTTTPGTAQQNGCLHQVVMKQ